MIQPGFLAYLDREDNPKEMINAFIADRIEAGTIKDRRDVIDSLKEIGEVTRAGKNYISVKPTSASKAIRLKGAIYEQEFNVESYIEDRRSEKEANENDSGHRAERAKEAAKLFGDEYKKRSGYNRQRYPTVEREDQKSVDDELVASSSSISNYLDRSLGDNAISIERDQKQHGRDSETESSAGDLSRQKKEFTDSRMPGNDRPVLESKADQGFMHKDDGRSGSGRLSSDRLLELEKGEERNERIRELVPKLDQQINQKARRADSAIVEIKSGINQSESAISEFIQRANEFARQQLQAVREYHKYVTEIVSRREREDQNDNAEQQQRSRSVDDASQQVERSSEAVERLERVRVESESSMINSAPTPTPRRSRSRDYEL
jgi:hypothetical protein